MQRLSVLAAEQDDIWYIDSGCSKHVTFRRDWFVEFHPRRDGDTILLGDNGEFVVAGEGTVIVDRLVDGVWSEARIEHVLYAPNLKKNSFSVGLCTVRGYSVVFQESDTLITRGNEIFATGVKQSNGNCRLLFRTRVQQVADGVKMTDKSDCRFNACCHGKAHRLPFKKNIVHVKWKPRKYFHSDVCGPMSEESMGVRDSLSRTRTMLRGLDECSS